MERASRFFRAAKKENKIQRLLDVVLYKDTDFVKRRNGRPCARGMFVLADNLAEIHPPRGTERKRGNPRAEDTRAPLSIDLPVPGSRNDRRPNFVEFSKPKTRITASFLLSFGGGVFLSTVLREKKRKETDRPRDRGGRGERASSGIWRKDDSTKSTFRRKFAVYFK